MAEAVCCGRERPDALSSNPLFSAVLRHTRSASLLKARDPVLWCGQEWAFAERLEHACFVRRRVLHDLHSHSRLPARSSSPGSFPHGLPCVARGAADSAYEQARSLLTRRLAASRTCAHWARRPWAPCAPTRPTRGQKSPWWAATAPPVSLLPEPFLTLRLGPPVKELGHLTSANLSTGLRNLRGLTSTSIDKVPTPGAFMRGWDVCRPGARPWLIHV